MNKLGTVTLSCAIGFLAAPFFETGPAMAQGRLECAPDIYVAQGRSSAAFRKARERRAKRRAIRRWQRAVEGRLLGGRGTVPPTLGTEFSDIDNAEVISFNCSGRPLTCTLRARPCRRR